MQPLETYKQTPRRYELIDYSKPPGPAHVPKIHELTEFEAHHKNKALAMNGTTLRFILLDD